MEAMLLQQSTDTLNACGQETEPTSQEKHYFIVPHNRNSIFTPRELFSNTFERLTEKKVKNEQLRIAVYGLGGSGHVSFIVNNRI